jgi:hypothetical protein
MIKRLAVLAPLAALALLYPFASQVAHVQLLPQDRVPNGDFSQPALAPAAQSRINPAVAGWEAVGAVNWAEGMVTSPPDATLVDDEEEGKAYRAGDGTQAVYSPWLDLPRGVQVLRLHLRGDQPAAVVRASIVDQASTHAESVISLGPQWKEAPLSVGDVAGTRARVRFEPLVGPGVGVLIGHIDPPRTLLAEWALHQEGGPLDVAVRSDAVGPFLSIAPPSRYTVGRFILASSAFELDSHCSNLTVIGRSVGGAERLDVSLLIDGQERWLGPFYLGSEWEPIKVPVGGLDHRELRLAMRASPAHGIDLRKVFVTPSC